MDLDDELIRRARRLTGIRPRAAVIRAALQALIQRESARQLAKLGGSDPACRPAPRRRALRS